jgi:hypothetical protein
MQIRSSIATLAALAALSLSGSAFAQSVDRARTAGLPRLTYVDERQSVYDSRRFAYDEGYREGVKEGEKDARRGERFWYEDERTYQRGDKGYHRRYGDPGRFQASFRNGYATGYSDAYQRIARTVRRDNRGPDRGPRYGYGSSVGIYGRPGYGYVSPAVEHGRREGYEKGVEDARRNRTFDARRHRWYRDGDRHYESRYGSRELYRDQYRRAFQDGYDRGYREGRYGY